jgi:hypothetical protein
VSRSGGSNPFARWALSISFYRTMTDNNTCLDAAQNYDKETALICNCIDR